MLGGRLECCFRWFFSDEVGGFSDRVGVFAECESCAVVCCQCVIFTIVFLFVLLQIQGESVSGLKYRGVVGTLMTVAREEGVRAWYQGLIPGLQRQVCFASIRIGLYDVVKSKYSQLFGCKCYLY